MQKLEMAPSRERKPQDQIAEICRRKIDEAQHIMRSKGNEDANNIADDYAKTLRQIEELLSKITTSEANPTEYDPIADSHRSKMNMIAEEREELKNRALKSEVETLEADAIKKRSATTWEEINARVGAFNELAGMSESHSQKEIAKARDEVDAASIEEAKQRDLKKVREELAEIQ